MMVSKAIKNMKDINMVMDAFSAVNDLSQDDYSRSISTCTMIGLFPLALQEPLMGQSPRSNLNLRFTLKKLLISRRYSLLSKRYLSRFQYLHRRPSPFSFPQISRKKL